MLRSESIGALAAALSAAQGAIRPAIRDAQNPHFKSKYADLSSIREACRAPLASNGLAVSQAVDIDGDRTVLVTTLMHSSGEWLSSCYPIDPVKRDPQGMGSAITYARRYSLAALVGVVSDEDDDGERASRRDDRDYGEAPRPAALRYEPRSEQPCPEPARPPSDAPASGERAEPLTARERFDALVAAIRRTGKLPSLDGTGPNLTPEQHAVLDYVARAWACATRDDVETVARKITDPATPLSDAARKAARDLVGEAWRAKAPAGGQVAA